MANLLPFELIPACSSPNLHGLSEQLLRAEARHSAVQAGPKGIMAPDESLPPVPSEGPEPNFLLGLVPYGVPVLGFAPLCGSDVGSDRRLAWRAVIRGVSTQDSDRR